MIKRRTKQLTIQLASLSKDESVLDLIHFPAPPLVPEESSHKIRTWAKGEVVDTNGDLESWLKTIRGTSLNWVQVRSTFESQKIDRRIVLKKAARWLHISPNHPLYSSVQGYTLSDHQNETIRGNLESEVIALRWRGISDYPTLLECSLEFESSLDADNITLFFFELIAEVLKQDSFSRLVTAGCADLASHNQPQNFLLRLLTDLNVTKFSDLASSFDDLHQIMIGASQTANLLASKIHGRCAARIYENSKGSLLGVIFLAQNCLDNPEIRIVASPHLIQARPKEKMGWNRSLGECDFGPSGGVFLTKRRARQLDEAGLRPTLPPWQIRSPIILEEYCEILGIDPDDMLVTTVGEADLIRARQSVDEQFAKLKSYAIDYRIFEAHRITYRDDSRLQQPLDFIKTRFFPKVVEREASLSNHKMYFDEENGELFIGAKTYLTQGRITQLRREHALTEPQLNWIYAPFIRAEYCRMSGLDPDKMLVDLFPQRLYERIQTNIDRVFEECPKEWSLKKRVWFSHNQTRPLNNSSDPLWTYLKDRFFRDV